MDFRRRAYLSGSAVLVLLMLQACAEVSFKRGAREQDWASDRQACADASDYVTCMEARGYFIRRLDDDASPSAEFADDAEADALPADDASLAASDVEADDLDDLSVRIKESGPRGESMEPPQARPSEATLRRAKAAEASKPKKPADPLERFTVSSWWKLGGRPEEVDSVTAACVKRLGPEHAAEGQRYTRGSLMCIKESGWKAFIRR